MSVPATATSARLAAPISSLERRRGLRVSIVEGISAQAHSALTGLGVNGNAITCGFVLLLGGGDLALAAAAAIPPLAAALQLLSAALAPSLTARKGWVVATSTLARVLWLPCALLPLVAPDLGLAAFLLLWALSCGLLSFSGNLWVSWMADLVPERVRSRYFSLRSVACTATGLVVGLGAGLALDRWFGGVPREAVEGAVLASADDRLRWTGFAVLFGLACVCGLLCGLLLRAQPEPAKAPRTDRPRGLRGVLLDPFREAARTPGLRGLLLFVAFFGFTNGFAAPFWTPYQLQQLRMDYATVNGTLVMLAGVAMIATLPGWGRLAGRIGNRNAAALAALLICTHPLYYLIATPERLWPIYVDAASSGISWGGYNLATFNLALGLSRGPGRERLFAVYAAVAGISQAISSLASGWLLGRGLLPMAALGPALGLDPRQGVFLVTAITRVLALGLLLLVVPEPRGVGLKAAVVAAIPHQVKARMEVFKFLVPRERRR